MKFTSPFSRLLVLGILLLTTPLAADARGYSSGGGHSYSSSSHSSSTSHSSSSSPSSSSSHSSSTAHSSSSEHSFSSPSHSFSSGSGSSGSSSHSSSSESSAHKSSSSSGKSYSSGSSSDDSNRHSYSSGKSYSSDASSIFSSSPKRNPGVTTGSSHSESSPSASEDFTFDTAAARARKEQASKEVFTHFNEARNPPPRNDAAATPPTAPPIVSRPASTRTYHDTVYIPDRTTLSTHRVRVQNVFQTYYTRPIVQYRDPYSSLFWWWLLDQSLDNRAMWAYQHRSDMDAERYQALLNQDAQLQTRVEQLEAQQTPADPTYVPAGIDRDLMYSDEHLQHTYSVRPTRSGSVMFMVFAVILAGSACYFFVWAVFIHRWQTSSQSST